SRGARRMAPGALRAAARPICADSLPLRVRRSERAADGLSSCLGDARRRGRMDEGDAAHRVCAPPAGRPLRALRRGVQGAALAAARRRRTVLLSVQADLVLGTTARLKADATYTVRSVRLQPDGHEHA